MLENVMEMRWLTPTRMQCKYVGMSENAMEFRCLTPARMQWKYIGMLANAMKSALADPAANTMEIQIRWPRRECNGNTLACCKLQWKCIG